MIELRPEEIVIEQRVTGLKPVLLHAAIASAIFAIVLSAMRYSDAGRVNFVEVLPSLVLFGLITLGFQYWVSRRQEYCLTDQRIVLHRQIDIALDDIATVIPGRVSLALETVGGQTHRIKNLKSPAKLATRINRARTGVSPDTGEATA